MNDNQTIQEVKNEIKKNLNVPDTIDIDHHNGTWDIVMRMSINLEENHDYNREGVLYGLLTGLINLNFRRYDERLIRKPEDRVKFLKHSIKQLQKELDGCLQTDEELAVAKEMYGDDLIGMRDAKKYGWNDKTFED